MTIATSTARQVELALPDALHNSTHPEVGSDREQAVENFASSSWDEECTKMEQWQAELDKKHAELAAARRMALANQVLLQQAEKRQLEEQRRANLKRQREEEEARKADRERRFREQQALAELKKKQDAEERERLRIECGLVTVEEAAELVLCRCALRAGVIGHLVCSRAPEAYGIRGKDILVVVVCSEKCRVHYHQNCWKDFEKALKEQRPEWKLKRGVQCVTDDCSGLITSAEVHQGPPGNCTVLQVLVADFKEEVKKEVERSVKGNKDKGVRLQKDERERMEPEVAPAAILLAARVSDANRPQRQDLRKKVDRHGRGFVPPEQPESSALAAEGVASQHEPTEETQQNQKAETQDVEQKAAVPDVQKLDLSNLRLVNKEDAEIRDIALSTKRVAKSKKGTKKAKEPNVVRLAVAWDDASDDRQTHAQGTASGGLSRDFFEELEEQREDETWSNTDMDGQNGMPSESTALDVNADFPLLSEAVEAEEDPNLYIYKTSMTAMLTDLIMEDNGCSRHLMIKNVDMNSVEDHPQDYMLPASLLRTMLASYGHVHAFRCFPPLGIAIAQFKTEESAIEATSMLQGSELGSMKMQICFLRLFPTDNLIEHRLQKSGVIDGDNVLPGELVRHTSVTRLPTAMTRAIPPPATTRSSLNVTAKECAFSIGSANSQQSAHSQQPGNIMEQGQPASERKAHVQPLPHPLSNQSGVMERLDNEQAPTNLQNADTNPTPTMVASSSKLPQELACFREIEVIGCDTASLMEYHNAGAAFGVMPDQLVDQGYGSVPTALIMYQVDTGELHGLWRVKGTKFVDRGHMRERVVEVHLLKVYPPLMESQHPGLLIRNSPGPGDILYPQRLDPIKTEQLLRLLHGVKGPQMRSHMDSTKGLPTMAAVSSGKDQRVDYDSIAAQALADEELARKLQDELLSEGEQGRQAAADEELARKLQEEEKSAVSYKSAVKADDYRIPKSFPAQTSKSGLQAMFPDLFSDLMPREGPPAKLSNRNTAPASPVKLPQQVSDSWKQTQVGNTGDEAHQSHMWLDSAAMVSSQDSHSSTSSLGLRPPAYRPKYRPPPAAAMSTPLAAQSTKSLPAVSAIKSGLDDDLLESLLGIPAAVPQKPDVQAAPQSPKVAQNANLMGLGQFNEESTNANQSPVLARNNSGATLASTESMEAVRPGANGHRKLPLCCVCSKHNASYIVMACRHWGPCMSCVPSAIDLNKFQTCMQCHVRTERLMRVYTR